MIQIKDKFNCSGCSACFNICPKNAIEMKEDDEGFKYPIVNKKRCINCGMCEKTCPIINKKERKNKVKVYAAINQSSDVRMQSSSGGIFTLIAEYILEQNGIVFGAKFDNDFNVKHEFIQDKEQLKEFRGSKYVQSNIGDTYKKTKEFLEKQKYVLFTGTPCQIEGLYAYLQNDYKKLYTQDIICHGVPSPKVWSKYLKYRKEVDNAILKKIEFKNKDDGWQNWNLKFSYEKKAYKNSLNNDIYVQAFLKNISLRDSCYNCNFKKKNRISDITLGDFWGIQNVNPKFGDNQGTSLVIINSDKGRELFEKIINNIIYEEVDFESAIKYNTSMIKSPKKPKSRKKFFENIDNIPIDKLVKRYLPKERKIIKILRKIKTMIIN